EIKVSVFIQQCSGLLDIDERILLTELNKIRLKKIKAHDRKEQQASKNLNDPTPYELPPADLFLLDEERTNLQPSSEVPAVITADVLQEREIVRILLNYGGDLAEWEGQGDVTIAPFLLNALHDINSEHIANAYMIDILKLKAEPLQSAAVRHAHSQQQPDVQHLAVRGVTTPYDRSRNWNDEEQKIYDRGEREHLQELTMQPIDRIK